MSALIERGGRRVRPSFNFSDVPENQYTCDRIAAQMLESLRNLTEDQVRVLERIERSLARIDRRLANNLPLRRKS